MVSPPPSSIDPVPNENTPQKVAEVMANKWWYNQLKPSGWTYSIPPTHSNATCVFIPVQYRFDVESNRYRGRQSSQTRNHYLFMKEHGKAGVHYAVGWLQLFHMVRKYASFSISKHKLAPGLPHYEIEDYEGPPLGQELNENETRTGSNGSQTKKRPSPTKKTTTGNTNTRRPCAKNASCSPPRSHSGSPSKKNSLRDRQKGDSSGATSTSPGSKRKQLVAQVDRRDASKTGGLSPPLLSTTSKRVETPPLVAPTKSVAADHDKTCNSATELVDLCCSDDELQEVEVTDEAEWQRMANQVFMEGYRNACYQK